MKDREIGIGVAGHLKLKFPTDGYIHIPDDLRAPVGSLDEYIFTRTPGLGIEDFKPIEGMGDPAAKADIALHEYY